VQIRQDERQEKGMQYFGGLAKNPPPGEKPDRKRRMTIKEGCIRRRHSKEKEKYIICCVMQCML